MAAFARGELQVLVATTVVEVGVDVPNASVMIVEHAERFGLSQLHQLRGRVGRDRHQSYCFLLYQSPLSDEARERLKAMTETTDGFEIAERDLVQRGPGDFFGTRQAGVPTFRMIDLVRDRDVLDLAQREAGQWFATVKPAPDADRAPAGELEPAVQAHRNWVIGDWVIWDRGLGDWHCRSPMPIHIQLPQITKFTQSPDHRFTCASLPDR